MYKSSFRLHFPYPPDILPPVSLVFLKLLLSFVLQSHYSHSVPPPLFSHTSTSTATKPMAEIFSSLPSTPYSATSGPSALPHLLPLLAINADNKTYNVQDFPSQNSASCLCWHEAYKSDHHIDFYQV